MLKTLLKKQLMEVFRSYYYNQKKNTIRSRAGTIGMFVLFGVLMIGVLGGTFAFLGYVMCGPLAEAGVGWLYFVIFGLLSIFLGTFGSVFSTFSGLYLAKDNDLLLAMPVPVRDILLSRLLNVYLLSLMYSAVVLIPATVVYWIFGTLNAAAVIGGLVLLLLVSVFVTLLSCLLGWGVAKLSLKLKNKSFVTVLLAILGIGLYYFLYFKAQVLLRDLMENAVIYGAQIKGSAYVLYLFGRIGEGDGLAMVIFTAAVALLTGLTWLLLRGTFLNIATATASQSKAVYRERTARQQNADTALLKKELRRFTSSANVMLNSGFGVLFLVLVGVALLIYGKTALASLSLFLDPGAITVLLCAGLCALNSMVDLTAASVSLEGKSLWIVKSLPVTSGQILRAKRAVQLLLCGIPALFAGISAALILDVSLTARLLLVLVSLLNVALLTFWGQFLNLKLPVLNWTSEMTVVKQSGSVAFALFGGWAYSIALGGLYFLVRGSLGAELYLGLAALLTAVLSLLLWLWLKKQGVARLEAL